MEYPRRVDAGINHSRRATRGATCPASVILHEPLRRSLLVAAGGHKVPPKCRCTLSYGHPGAHQGLAYTPADGAAGFAGTSGVFASAATPNRTIRVLAPIGPSLAHA